jgi:hypothetical protein
VKESTGQRLRGVRAGLVSELKPVAEGNALATEGWFRRRLARVSDNYERLLSFN